MNKFSRNLEGVQWLFLDLNSYFASVEQQEQPHLRNRPMAVLPVQAETTCCIAASYEAKAFGVKTGTIVAEARRLCPSIEFVEARHEIYTAYHNRIVAIVERCVPVDQVLSIDEMACRLTGSGQTLENAFALSAKIKLAIRQEMGEAIRCSIGLAPNRFLAKLASDMQKPDGLTVLKKADLPQALFKLDLRDFSGIGSKTQDHLALYGVRSVEQLCALSRTEMRDLWGGVWGERFYDWVRGEEVEEVATKHVSLGHSHVLEPSLRTAEGAGMIVRRLLAKAAIRLRRGNYWTTGVSVMVKFIRQPDWEGRARIPEAQDTPTLLKTLNSLWEHMPKRSVPFYVGVTLSPLIPRDRHIGNLFDDPRQERISLVMDAINAKHGNDTAYFASLKDSLRAAPTRISFNRVPEMSEFD